MEKTNFYDAGIFTGYSYIKCSCSGGGYVVFSLRQCQSPATLFGMSAGTVVAVINYISQIFSPVESLGMEIQTIQAAYCGREKE